MSWLRIAKTYDKCNSIVRSAFRRNLRGVGYLLRKIKQDHVFMLHGQKMLFSHEVAGCYVGLINGNYTEKETHLFLNKVINGLDCDVNFVDVGANIGEFILDLASNSRVKKVYAFEPHPECAKTCRSNVQLNGLDHKVRVIQKILSADTVAVNFSFNPASPNASGITEENMIGKSIQNPTTLDIEMHDFSLPTVILIDVEGAEPLVMKGGSCFISKNSPLIIFEFNTISKTHFNLINIKDILGTQYEIYRLRNDGCLDIQFDDTWNCVAVNVNSVFYRPLTNLIVS